MANDERRDLLWHKEAEDRLKNVPLFVRMIVKKTVEKYAMKMGYVEIDTNVWEEAKKNVGM